MYNKSWTDLDFCHVTGEGGAVQEAVSSDDGVSTVVVESVTRHIGVLL